MAKVFLSCPRCQSKLNLKHNAGRVGICSFCGWAGSLKSESHDQWVQLKVSFFLVLAGLTISFLAIKVGQNYEDKYWPETYELDNYDSSYDSASSAPSQDDTSYIN